MLSDLELLELQYEQIGNTNNNAIVYFVVDYKEKEEAKKQGLRWNPKIKKWYLEVKNITIDTSFEITFEIANIECDGMKNSIENIINKHNKKLTRNIPVRNNNILFVKSHAENYSGERYGNIVQYKQYFNKGVMWVGWGRSGSSINRNNVSINTSIIVINQRIFDHPTLFTNLPLSIRKVYVKKPDNKDVAIFGYEKLLNRVHELIKMPYGCELIFFNTFAEIKELDKKETYNEHVLV